MTLVSESRGTIRWLASFVFGLTLLLMSAIGVSAEAIHEGAELIGTPARDWDISEWLNSKPLSLKQLRGRVVLVRWWTGPECPYCAASAPYLDRWYKAYQNQGLVVIGIYHHKSPTPLSREHVTQLVERYGFRFPVAVDPNWQTLQRWWLHGHNRRWTAVSFLIDRKGMIRYVHPGGSYSEAEAGEMESMIQELLGSTRFAPPSKGVRETNR